MLEDVLTPEIFALRLEEQRIIDELARVRAEMLPLSDSEQHAVTLTHERSTLQDVPTDGPYRSDPRARAIDQELEALEVDSARYRALRGEESALMVRAERLRSRLERMGAARREATLSTLAVLDEVKPAAPCRVRWDEMEGVGAVRCCRTCNKPFYDLSAMTHEQAVGLLVGSAQSARAGIYRRDDGTLAVGDCPKGTQRRQARREMAVLAALVVGIAAALFASGQGPSVSSGPSRDHTDGRHCTFGSRT
jgi:hypothetical protein